MELPDNVGTGRVTGQFIVGVLDGADPGQMPDALPARGTVKFTPQIPYAVDATATPNPVTILQPSQVAVFDEEGYVCTPVSDDDLRPAYRGVRLIATDDTDISTTAWTWTASYSFEPHNGQALTLPSHSFAVPKFGEVDLATAVKIPSSAGVGTEQITALAASAQSAAVDAQSAAERAEAAAAVTDSGVAGLLTNPASLSGAAVAGLVEDAGADKMETSQRGAPNGVAPLGSDSRVPSANLPAYLGSTAIVDLVDDAAADKLDDSERGAPNGVAPLGADSKVPTANLPIGTANGVASLGADIRVPQAQIPTGQPADQYDYVAVLAARNKYTRMQLKKVNSLNEVEVTCFSPSGLHTTYQFYGNTGAQDDYRVLAQVWEGTSASTLTQAAYKWWADMATTGTFTAAAASFVYTTDKVTPATITNTVVVEQDGSDIRFHTYKDNRGGLWEVKLTGPASATVNVSTWASAASYTYATYTTIASNLPKGTYTLAAKFLGDDPLNVPSTGAGTARGWLANNAAPSTSTSNGIIFDVFSPFRAINKENLVKPASNMDFAVQTRPVGGATYEWIPYHGVATAFQADAPVYLDGDVVIDVASMPVGGYRNISHSFELVQRVYGRNTTSGATNLVEIATSHLIRSNAVVSMTGRFKRLVDVQHGDNYFMMFPASMAIFDTVVSSIGTRYTNNSSLIGTETPLVTENDTAAGYLYLSSTNKNLAAAVRFNNPQETIRRGKANKNPDATKTFLQHRDASIVKVYSRAYLPGTVVPAGTIDRFSGDFIYTQGLGTFDQFAI